MGGQLHDVTALSPENNPRYPSDRKTSGPRGGFDVMTKIKIH
jgi:hypothetical protein